MKSSSAILLLAVAVFGSLATASDSYLFGASASDAFGLTADSRSARYQREATTVEAQGFTPLNRDFGSAQSSAVKILVKDDSINSSVTRVYLDTLANEKSTLMAIYGLSNSDYNRLAAIAFGILGRETKFGTSVKYLVKESVQPQVFDFKLARKKLADYVQMLRKQDPSKFFALKTWVIRRNSRGLTQIKTMPESITRFYCLTENQLNDPKTTAIATLGFLAESLKILKNRVRNRDLLYVTNENLFDYVLYVYSGSIRQLVNPVMDYNTGRITNDPASPDRNMYIQTVHAYMRSLAFFEDQRKPLALRTDSACRVPGDR